MRALCVELGKHRICTDQTLNGPLEKHKHHHDTENLQAVARKVHHDRVHRELFRRGKGDFPCFLDLEGVSFDGFGGGGCGLLFLLLLLLLSLDTKSVTDTI